MIPRRTTFVRRAPLLAGRFRRSLGVGAVITVSALTLSGVAATSASADPISAKKAEAVRLAKQIQAQGDRVSILAEQVDEARLKADRIQASLGDAKVKLAEAGVENEVAKGRLAREAIDAYVRGGSGSESSQVAADSSTDPAVTQHYVRQVEQNQVDALDSLRASQLHFADERSRLDAAQKQAATALGQVDAAQRAAAKAESDAEATLASVKGDLADLVSAEQARQAAADQAQVQAALAARAQQAASRSRASGASSGTSGSSGGSGGSGGTVTHPGGGDIGPPPPVGSGAAAAVEEAKRQLGKPYSWGAAGPGSFDCSGLTLWAWRAGGRSLPHSSGAQYSSLPHVPVSAIQPGDLLFYGSPIHHVGIYVGGGMMIEAPHSGTVVLYGAIYRSDLVGAARP